MLPETFWGRIQYLLQQYGSSFLSGAGNTMIIAIVGTFLGCLIGFIVGIIQTIPVDKRDSAVKKTLVGFLKFIMACYVEFFRGTPMMVQAMFIYYGSAYLFNINMSMWFAAFFVVSINTGAYMAETVRAGIGSIDEKRDAPVIQCPFQCTVSTDIEIRQKDILRFPTHVIQHI